MSPSESLLVNRRQFVRVSAGGLASAVFAPGLVHRRQVPELRLALIHEESDANAQGMALGFREAEHAGMLLGRNVARLRIGASADEVDRARREGAHAVILGVRTSDASAIADACARHDLLFVNASVPDDKLRRNCSSLVFHVVASEAMVAHARAASAEGSAEPPVLMWHPSLVRFGAAQLNDRFLEAHGSPMTSDAWAGWVAVKIAWEGFLRAAAPAPRGIAEYLSSDSTHFDGHKGVPLSFRAWDHQLRQPVYVVRASGTLSEVPAPAGPDTPIRQYLDSIGEKPGESKCIDR